MFSPSASYAQARNAYIGSLSEYVNIRTREQLIPSCLSSESIQPLLVLSEHTSKPDSMFLTE